MNEPAVCYHCGRELSDSQRQLAVDGAPQFVCGDDCARVVTRIADRGLTEFYRYRTGPTRSLKDPDTYPDRWRSYDREALQKEFVTTQTDGSRRGQLLLQGVRCAACSWLIENALGPTPGLRSIHVDPLTSRASLHWDPKAVALSDILAQLARLGYTPLPFTQDSADLAATHERRTALRRLVIAGLGMMQVMSFAVALYAGAWREPQIQEFLRLVSLLVATPVVFYSGAPFFQGAWNRLRNGQLGMDVPIALAIGAAWSASVWNSFSGQGEVYFDSATMFVFFLSAARFLEMSGRHQALSVTGAMAKHLPKVATRCLQGQTEEVGVTELEVGDQLLVAPGSALPADGVLLSDHAQLNESLLTGESTPVTKTAGDPVVAGSVNLGQALQFEVAKIGTGTLLAQITDLVVQAQADKPKIVTIADRFASYFVGGVLCAALLTGLVWWNLDSARAFEIVLAVLVVTCPCALALATPAAFAVATSALAKRGFMLRHAGALQRLNQLTDVVFDKTGTLTSDEITVSRTLCFGGSSQEKNLGIAAALEAYSEHPLARAFARGSSVDAATDVRAVPGAGLTGRIAGEEWRIGTRAFVEAISRGEAPPETLASADTRVVYLGNRAGLSARFDIAEAAREHAALTTAELRARGLALHIASGDKPGPVRRLAEQLQIDSWKAEQLSTDKLNWVRNLQGHDKQIAMVGDGINDSPVLAGADVSIAMGGGTDLAQHSADCVLLGTSLWPLAEAVHLSQRTMGIVKQNLTWAVIYNIAALPLAAAGLLAPWMAALGMSVSSLLVTLNAMRLGRRGMSGKLPSVANGAQEADAVRLSVA